MEKYSETSPCIVDSNALRLKTVDGGMWDYDKETRQSGSNAAYDGVQEMLRSSGAFGST